MKRRSEPIAKRAAPKNAAPKRARPKRARPKQAAPAPPPEAAVAVPSQPIDAAFPIVGIGASAGGLEALELFLGNVPEKSGMAFVVVQHLDPTHKGMLVELLQRGCPIPVVQITDRLKVEVDHVYVIPPNADLSVLRGVLHLLAPIAPRGQRLPIDFFFRSLGHDRREQSIGVILSGMGSDGTLGLAAIREHGGAAFVQEPTTAKFDGMPRSAIGAGVADIVAPAQDLPAHVLAFRKHLRPALRSEPTPIDAETQGGLDKTVALLREATGHDFSQYKTSTLHRRVLRRMSLHQLDSIDRYVRYLRENPKEGDLLFKELLIGVTSFFRDPAAWACLKDVALPALVSARPKNATLRAWVPACSTGEEAYSLAMVFIEAVDGCAVGSAPTLQIFATDLDREAIERARQATYPSSIAQDVSPERLSRFFVEAEQGFRVSRQIRDMVVFATHNVIQDPPFTKLDFLSCRNLLIYLAPELQQKLVPLFHYGLRPGGLLFLGSAEAIGTFTDLFFPVDRAHRIFRRLEPAVTLPVDFPSSFGHRAGPGAALVPNEPGLDPKAPNLQTLAEQHLLQRFGPAAVLVGPKGDVLYVNGRTESFLELPAGKANWNIFAMARKGLREPLGTALQKAARTQAKVELRGVPLPGQGRWRRCDVIIEPLTQPPRLQGTVMIAFTETPARGASERARSERATRKGSTVADLHEELGRTRDELRVTSEEIRTSQEELRSANEELQSTNEELQSTNEELMTSKEEMQSMNEELQTVNHELQAKVDDLSDASDDLKNLLDSTEIAVIFLDRGLNVRRFTPTVTSIIKLIPGDIGRPLADLASGLDYPELFADAREVLRTLAFRERPVSSRDGRWFSVRIMPYRTCDDRIDGLVITFTNVTALKMLEQSVNESRHEAV